MIKLKNQILLLSPKSILMRLCFTSIRVLFISLMVFTISCAGEDKKQSDGSEENASSAEQMTKLKLDTLKVPKLNTEAKKATEDWIHYTALNSEMQRLENYSIQDVISNADAINRVVDSLVISLPEVFETKAVKARVMTLDTHTKLLLATSKKQKPDTKALMELSNKLKIDFNNLILQLNEVYIINSQNQASEINF